MPIPAEALALENRNLGMDYEATLAEAYKILRSEWDKGNRDREVGLHLMFIAWYGIIEPSHITGFTETPQEKHELNTVLFEVHEYFKDKVGDDAEMLYTFGLMADMFWYMFEHDKYWEQVGIDYKKRYRESEPDGLDPSIFKDRGAYGEYYEGQVNASKLPNGY
jgi:hypothetical protein